MDKRILKTKHALKEALFTLLKEEKIEDINTAEICECAYTSRNTFYTYYPDKYALLNDCFEEMVTHVQESFRQLQCSTNPEQNLTKTFQNLVDSILDTETDYEIISVSPSLDLLSMYYHFILHHLGENKEAFHQCINPDYDLHQIYSFLILGLFGFIHSNPLLGKDAIRQRTRRLIADLLASPIFRERQNAPIETPGIAYEK